MTDDAIRKGANTWVMKQMSFLLIFLLPMLFVSAGTLRWFNGWLQFILYVIVVIVQIAVLMPRHAALLAERSRGQKGTKSWDWALATFAAAWLPMATWIVAGIDFRNGWTPPHSAWLIAAGALVWLAGYALTIWAMASNNFFSATVRIQEERGHTVAMGGPYRFVRHPGYVGAILFQLVTPLILGSWWAAIPSTLAAFLYIVRTGLEDRTLIAELQGYEAYTRQTKYRLIPGIW